MEAAAIARDAINKGPKRGPTPEADWSKVKFDRQIIAIARVTGASIIYTNDDQLARHAKEIGIFSIKLDELPEPLKLPQIEMKLDPPESKTGPEDEETD